MPCRKAKGQRAKTRHLFKKESSKVTVNTFLQEIPSETSVDIKIDSSVHSAMPPQRYHGYTGVVTGKQGSAYLVDVSKGNKKVELIVNAAHLHISKGIHPKAKKTKVEKKEIRKKETEVKAKVIEVKKEVVEEVAA